MEQPEVKMKVALKFKMGTLPNFLITSEGLSISIGSLSDEELKEYGEAWTLARIERAKMQAGRHATRARSQEEV